MIRIFKDIPQLWIQNSAKRQGQNGALLVLKEPQFLGVLDPSAYPTYGTTVPKDRFYDIDINSGWFFWFLERSEHQSLKLNANEPLSEALLNHITMSTKVFTGIRYENEQKLWSSGIKQLFPHYESIDWIAPNSEKAYWRALIRYKDQVEVVPLFVLALMQNTLLHAVKQKNWHFYKSDLSLNVGGTKAVKILEQSGVFKGVYPIFNPPTISSLSDNEKHFVFEWLSLLQMSADRASKNEDQIVKIQQYCKYVFGSEYIKSELLCRLWMEKYKSVLHSGLEHNVEDVAALLGLYLYKSEESAQFEQHILTNELPLKQKGLAVKSL